MTIYSIYKKNHPVISKQVVNVIDLGYPWCRKGFPRTTIIALPYKKNRNLQELSQEEKEYNKIHSKKEDNSGTYHLQIKKVQNNERYIQKQIKKIQ